MGNTFSLWLPPTRNGFVCRNCLGPVDPQYAQCWGCKALLLESHPVGDTYEFAPPELRQRIVPMTTAQNPSPWYNYLATYERGQLETFGPVLASIAHLFLTTHADAIADLLGGEPTLVTVVPSKKGYAFDKQPLVLALRMVPPLREQLVPTLVYRPVPWNRRQYQPHAFGKARRGVAGERVVLLEDSWVTGATGVSAAGALHREGAAAVVILPIARVINEDWLSQPVHHPYRAAMRELYDIERWPREPVERGWARL